MKINAKHCFSLYFENLSEIISGLKIENKTEIKDSNLRKRIINVLRLKADEKFLLFDSVYNVQFVLLKDSFENKKLLVASIVQINKNVLVKPEIILCPALLKKNFFEDVLYFAAQMGASKVCPLLTEKICKNWLDQKAIDRLKKIMISACEQSGNFVIPDLCNPKKLQTFLPAEFDPKLKNKKICFHDTGKSLFGLLQNLHETHYDKIYLLIGPEGDFIEKELEMMQEQEFQFFVLTPTILRSVDAVAVGLGAVRSVAKV